MAWSLEVEIQFYVIAPFLAILFFPKRNVELLLKELRILDALDAPDEEEEAENNPP